MKAVVAMNLGFLRENIPFSDFKDFCDAVNCIKNDQTPRTATIAKIFSLLNNSRLGIFNVLRKFSLFKISLGKTK